MRDWLVAADDRTGALEVAAELAAVRGDAVAVHTGAPAPGESGVVDLGSRAVPGEVAAAIAAAVDSEPCRWTAHKIDSTLRGNWVAELRARQHAIGRPVLIVAAWPLMGRTCVGGVVHVHGRPIGAVADHLPVTVLDDAAGLARWRPGADDVAAVDVVDGEALGAVASVAATLDVLVAGPAGAIGAVAAARYGRAAPSVGPSLSPPFLVVCGSATVVAAEQLDRLAVARPDVAILRTPPADGELHPSHAADVAAAARARVAAGAVGTLVVVGGDTAAAVLGDAPRLVGGYAAPGMPWSRSAGGAGPLVVSKAGAFGPPDALVTLLAGH